MWRTRALPALQRLPGGLSFWLPIVTSLVSLAFSLGGLYIATREPDVLLILPDQLRVAQGGSTAYLYIQPTFVGAGRNDRAEVILDMHLQVSRVGENDPPAEFYWDEEGAWIFDAATQELSWSYVADAAPFLVTRQEPKLPTGLFIGPSSWSFEEGVYRITVVADRAIVRRAVAQTLEVEFSGDEINTMNASQGTRFIVQPATPLQ